MRPGPVSGRAGVVVVEVKQCKCPSQVFLSFRCRFQPTVIPMTYQKSRKELKWTEASVFLEINTKHKRVHDSQKLSSMIFFLLAQSTAIEWGFFFHFFDVMQVQNGARPKCWTLASTFVIPCPSFRTIQQQETLKSLYWFWQKCSWVGGCVPMCARVCVCVGHRVELQSLSYCSACTHHRVQIPTSKSSFTRINTLLTNANKI